VYVCGCQIAITSLASKELEFSSKVRELIETKSSICTTKNKYDNEEITHYLLSILFLFFCPSMFFTFDFDTYKYGVGNVNLDKISFFVVV
jgi:hypothetical protein